MKKGTRKKRKTPARRRKKSSKRKFFTPKLFSFLALFGLLLFSMAFAGYVIFFRTTIAHGTTLAEAEGKVPFEEPYPVIPEQAPDIPPVLDDSLPMVAIIIDDMGFQREIGKELLGLPMNLTFSFLASAPHTSELEEEAYQAGRVILMHLPMEPKGKEWDPGPASLRTGHTSEEQKVLFERNLAAVPHAVGVNNHMGSLYTEDRGAMDTLMELLHEQGLFFVDSFTTAESKGLIAALAADLPAARRHIFLDNVHSSDKVCEQLKKLVVRAEKQGWAIGIGHPNESTLAALTNCRERLLKRVQLVSAQELVRELSRR